MTGGCLVDESASPSQLDIAFTVDLHVCETAPVSLMTIQTCKKEDQFRLLVRDKCNEICPAKQSTR